MWKLRNTQKVLFGRRGGKIPLDRSKYKREDVLKMNLREAGWESMLWNRLAMDKDQCWALVNTVMKQFHKSWCNYVTS
jgi:hypothetical protein